VPLTLGPLVSIGVKIRSFVQNVEFKISLVTDEQMDKWMDRKIDGTNEQIS